MLWSTLSHGIRRALPGVWRWCAAAAFVATLSCAGATTTSTTRAGANTVDAFIEAGNDLVSKGEYDEAVRQYNRALALDMGSAEAHGNLSVAYYYAGRYDEAIREAQQAIVMAPDEINWRFNLGAAYSKKGDYERAVAAYEAAVDLARRLPDETRSLLRSGLIGLGRSCELAEQYGKALDAYREALVFAPEDIELMTGVGNIYFRQGKLAEAKEMYQQVIAIDPTHQLASYNLGLVYARTGRYDRAIALFTRARDLTEGALGTVEGSSLNRADRTRTERIAAFRREIGKMGGSGPRQVRAARPPPYTYALGITYYEQHNDEEALNAFARALEEDPSLAEAHLYIGNIYTRQNRLDAAIDAYQDALRVNPEFPEAYNNLGSLYAEQGRTDEAMTAYRQALEHNARFHDARTNLGLLYAEAGRYEEAIEAYQTVIKSGAGIPEAHNNLCMVYLHQNRIEEAIAEAQKALRLRGDYPEAYNNIGLAYGRRAYFDDVMDTWSALASAWTGERIKTETGRPRQRLSDWLLLRRIPANSSGVGGAARERYREGVEQAARGLFDHAARSFQAALETRPGWPAAQLALGSVYLAQERWSDAIGAFETAVKMDASDPLAHASLAIARAQSGAYGEAVDAWAQAVRQAPKADRDTAKAALTTAEERRKMADEAIKALQTACAIKPGFAKAHFNLGVLYDQIHRYQDAVTAYEQVASLEPDVPVVHFRLGIAYSRVGRMDDARAAIQRYIAGVTDPLELPQVETFLKRMKDEG